MSNASTLVGHESSSGNAQHDDTSSNNETAVTLHPLHSSKAYDGPLARLMLFLERNEKSRDSCPGETLYSIMQTVLATISHSNVVQAAPIEDVSEAQLIEDEFIEVETAEDEIAEDETTEDEITGDEKSKDQIPEDQSPADQVSENQLPEDEVFEDQTSDSDNDTEIIHSTEEEQISLSLHEYILENTKEDYEEALKAVRDAHEEQLQTTQEALEAANKKVAYLQRRLKTESEKDKILIQKLKTEVEGSDAALKEERLVTEQAKARIKELETQLEKCNASLEVHTDLTRKQTLLICNLNTDLEEFSAVAHKQRSIADASDEKVVNLRGRIRAATDELFEKTERFDNQMSAANTRVIQAEAVAENLRREVEAAKETARNAEELAARIMSATEEERLNVATLRAAIETLKEQGQSLEVVNQEISRRATLDAIHADAREVTIEILQKEVDDLNEIREGLEGEVEELKEAVAGSEIETMKAEVEELEVTLRRKDELIGRVRQEIQHYNNKDRELREQLAIVIRDKADLREAKETNKFAKETLTQRLCQEVETSKNLGEQKLVVERQYAAALREFAQGTVDEDCLVKTIAHHLQIVLDDNERLLAKATESDEKAAEANQERAIREIRCGILRERVTNLETELADVTKANEKYDIDQMNLEMEVAAKERENNKLEQAIEELEESERSLRAKLREEHAKVLRVLVDRSQDAEVIQEAFNAVGDEGERLVEQLSQWKDAFRRECALHRNARMDYEWIADTWRVFEESGLVHIQRMHQAEAKYVALKREMEGGHPDENDNEGGWETDSESSDEEQEEELLIEL